MLNCSNKKAQVISSEYVLVIFIVVGMMTAMTMYMTRALQARVFDAHQAMGHIIVDRAQGKTQALNVYTRYEPYYYDTNSTTYTSQDTEATLEPGFTTGNYRKEINDEKATALYSVTSPPKYAE